MFKGVIGYQISLETAWGAKYPLLPHPETVTLQRGNAAFI